MRPLRPMCQGYSRSTVRMRSIAVSNSFVGDPFVVRHGWISFCSGRSVGGGFSSRRRVPIVLDTGRSAARHRAIVGCGSPRYDQHPVIGPWGLLSARRLDRAAGGAGALAGLVEARRPSFVPDAGGRLWTRTTACDTRLSALMHAVERENQLPEPAAARSASSAARSAAATAALIWPTQSAKSPAGSDSTSDGRRPSAWPASAGSGSRSCSRAACSTSWTWLSSTTYTSRAARIRSSSAASVRSLSLKTSGSAAAATARSRAAASRVTSAARVAARALRHRIDTVAPRRRSDSNRPPAAARGPPRRPARRTARLRAGDATSRSSAATA